MKVILDSKILFNENNKCLFSYIYIYNLAFTVKGFKVIYYCNELLFFLNWGFTPCKTENPL